MHIPEDLDAPAQINIVPMIDVIFAILTFFIMATLFLTRSDELPVTLPAAETSAPQSQREVVVTVDAAGQITLAQQPVSLTELATRVEQLRSESEAVLVTINADQQVRHGQVVAVMDELRQVRGAQIGIATQRP